MAFETIRTTRKSKKLSLEKLAEHVGISTSQMSRIETGKRKARYDEMVRIADRLGIRIEDISDVIQSPAPSKEAPSGSVSEPSRAFRPAGLGAANAQSQAVPIDVPVYGGGPIGGASYSAAYNVEIAKVKRPPGLANMAGVYAIHMIGSSMSPRFEDGELIFVSATRAPAIGDDVVMETVKFHGETHSRRYIRRLIEMTETEWVLEQFKPPATERFPMRTVKFVYRIFPTREMLGV
jgi:phage repressor protein C with HTH and peptisase S24 domain